MSSLTQALQTLLHDKSLHNVEFVTSDGYYVSANLCILSARSQVFYNKYSGITVEKDAETDMYLCHMTEVQVGAIVEYCYTDQIESLTLSNAVQIARAADEFELPGLVEVVRKFVMANLNNRRTAGKMLCEAVDSSSSNSSSNGGGGGGGGDRHPFIGLLKKKFLSKPIGYGELNGFSLETLKVLLEEPTSMTEDPTKWIKMFLAVVDWAWHAIGDEEMGGSSRYFLRIPTGAEHNSQALASDSLQRLFEYMEELINLIDFTSICPHYLDRIKNEFPYIPEDVLNRAFHYHALNPSCRRSSSCPGCAPLQVTPYQSRSTSGRVGHRECQAAKEWKVQFSSGKRVSP